MHKVKQNEETQKYVPKEEKDKMSEKKLMKKETRTLLDKEFKIIVLMQ